MPRPCYSGKIICIDKSKRLIRLLVNGRTIVRLDARFGASRTPTRNGMRPSTCLVAAPNPRYVQNYGL